MGEVSIEFQLVGTHNYWEGLAFSMWKYMCHSQTEYHVSNIGKVSVLRLMDGTTLQQCQFNCKI